MPGRIIWNDVMDAALISMRAEGASWLEVADRLGVQDKSAVRRAHKLGLSTERMNIGPVSGKDVMAGAQPPTRPVNQSAREKWRLRGQGPARSSGLAPNPTADV